MGKIKKILISVLFLGIVLFLETGVVRADMPENGWFVEAEKTYYYVALYYPAGNIPGKYNENVLQEPVIKNEENDEEEISQKDNEDETEKAGLGNNKDNDFNKKETDSKEKNNKGKNHEKEGKKENEENNLINGGDDENDYQISEKDNGIEHKV